MEYNASNVPLTSEYKPRGRFIDYVKIARLDHCTKHIFIVPGIVLALLLRGQHTDSLVTSVVGGFIAAICIASANYVINEWLDRQFDQHHPDKSKRAAVQRELKGSLICVEWALLVVVGLAAAFAASPTMFAVAALFALQGIVYNVRPLRTKELPYLDVISESVNNPIRLIIGWAMIDPTSLPPSSIIFSYWLGGAFLMAAKRMSEYREIVASTGKDSLVRYRASFAGYTEESLTISCFAYAMLSSFFIAVFLIKYRVEYIVLVPLITALFCLYLGLSMRPGSSAQKPERLFKERGLMALVLALTIGFAVTTVVDLPWIDSLTQQRYMLLK